jgi:chromosome segregation protein
MQYEHIQADLKVLLREWYGYHWHKIQKDLLHAQETLKAQEKRLNKEKYQQQDVDQNLDVFRDKLQALRNDLNQWHKKLSDLHSKREQISRQLAVMEERERSFLTNTQGLKGDIANLEEEQIAQNERINNAANELDVLMKDLQEAQDQAKIAQENLRLRESERSEVEKSLKDARRKLVDHETRQVKTTAHYNELLSRSTTLEKSQKSLQASIAGEAETLEKSKKRVSQTSRELQQKKDIQEELEDTLRFQRVLLEELEETRKNLVKEQAQLDADYARAKAQLEVIEQAERSFSGLNQGAKFILNAAKNGKLGGKYTAISSLFEVPEKFEVAIAAVLGEFLDGIILDENADAEEALSLLEKGENGRTVLLSNHKASDSDKSLKVSADDKVFGIGADLISSNGTNNGTNTDRMKRILSKVVVVDDRKTAVQVIRDLPVYAQCVTLAGEVFTGEGVVIAGKDGRSGVVGRQRQKRELAEKMERIDQKVGELEKKLSATEVRLEDERKTEARSRHELQDAGKAFEKVTRENQQAQLELKQAEQRSEWHRKQLSDLEVQIKATDEAIEQSLYEQKDLEKEIEQLNQSVREFRHSLNALPLDELQAELGHWNTNAAVAARAVKEAKFRINDYNQALNRNQQQIQSINNRLEEMSQAKTKLENEKAELRSEANLLQDEIELLQEKIEPSERQLEKAEAEYTNLQDNLISTQQGVTLAERYVTQAQLDVTRQREALESLQRRINEDFGLVMYEYSADISGPNPLPLGNIVQELPKVTEISQDLEDEINRQRSLLRRLGAINLEARDEFESVKERYEFMSVQLEDLNQADQDLRQVIDELDELMKQEFRKTFDQVNAEFKTMFTRLFGGGSAHLVLEDEDNPTETGIDIEARLPGRRQQGLSLLSGGERSLTAVALIFSLLKISPTPFCVMDEVDAMLDEANVGRFCDLLKELSEQTQFIVITHNRNTVQTADVIYGVTMGRDSASQVISLRLDEVSEDMVI